MADELRDQALRHWQRGDALEAGRLIFEGLAEDVRPRWAADVLEAVLSHTGATSPAIDVIRDLAATPDEWPKAHDAFRVARREVLHLDDLETRSPAQDLTLGVISLAELVAKLLYNATDPDDPFDDDTGWWIAPVLKHVLDAVGDDAFARSMWSVLSAPAASVRR